jgi:hypothetical protein
VTVFEVKVYLYEGEDISLGIFSDMEKAEEIKKEAEEDWAGGPNVEFIDIHERGVK